MPVPIAGSRTGYAYAVVSTQGETFQTDRAHLIHEIHFHAVGNNDLTVASVQLQFEGQAIFQGQQVPLRMLQTPLMTAANSNSQFHVTFRPLKPILWDPSFPLTIVPSVDLQVALHGEPLEEKG